MTQIKVVSKICLNLGLVSKVNTKQTSKTKETNKIKEKNKQV